MIKPSPRGLLAVKILVTLVLVGVILFFADWTRFWQILRSANLLLVVVVFCLMVFCVSLSAWKWQALLRIHGAQFSWQQLHRWYFVAMFFNNFLPTSIGGDGYRVWRTFDNARSRTSAILAVLVERLSGILTLLFIGLIGAVIGWFSHGHVLSAWYAIFGLAGLVLGSIVLGWLFAFGGLQRLLEWRSLPEKLRIVIEHLDDYRQNPAASVRAIGLISVIFHAVSLFWMGLLLRSVGDSISLTDLALVAAIISVVTVIPLSINGIGVVDGSFIWLTGQFGVSYEAALGAMLLQRALLIPISLVGAWLYFRDGEGRPSDSSSLNDAAEPRTWRDS